MAVIVLLVGSGVYITQLAKVLVFQPLNRPCSLLTYLQRFYKTTRPSTAGAISMEQHGMR